ncbi:hypothetical protein AN958_07176 [Leucoagaricus sp. SymC.cos]|nr:hypothetical protein AN958_07176 [Leucoagaricus sp. SymC.cos]
MNSISSNPNKPGPDNHNLKMMIENSFMAASESGFIFENDVRRRECEMLIAREFRDLINASFSKFFRHDVFLIDDDNENSSLLFIHLHHRSPARRLDRRLRPSQILKNTMYSCTVYCQSTIERCHLTSGSFEWKTREQTL